MNGSGTTVAGIGFAADDKVQPGAVGGKVFSHIAHGDRTVHRGAEAAGGDNARLGPVFRHDRRLRAGRRASVRADADAAADRAVVELVAHHQAAGEVPVQLAAFADDPGQAGLDRAGQFVEVVAVEAKPGLQPQRVAGAEADRDDLRLLDQAVGQGFGLVGGNRNLEAVLAGVAGAGNQAVDRRRWWRRRCP